ncbi:MAG: MMPL family transporter, partial [Spirochaeta sp.]
MPRRQGFLEIAASILFLGIITVSSLILVESVSIDSSVMDLYSAQDEQSTQQRMLIFVLPSDAPFSREVLQQNLALHESLSKNPVFDQIHNLFTVSDYVNRGDVLTREPLADPDRLDPDAIASRIEQSPSLSLLLLTRSGSAWLQYAELSREVVNADILSVIDDIRTDYPGLVIGGIPYWEASASDLVSRSLTVYIILGLGFLLGAFLLLLRSLRQALLLWASACIAMLGTGGIIGLVQQPLTLFILPVPVLVLGLSTSYTLHMRAGLRQGSWTEAVRSHGKIVLLTAFTTIAGLSGMLISSNEQLHAIGKISILGVILAAAIAFAVTPLMARLFTGSIKARERVSSGFIRVPKKVSILLSILGFLFLAAGWMQVKQSGQWTDIFWQGSSIGRETVYVYEEAPGHQEIEITLSHPDTFYWVEYDHFVRLYEWEQQLSLRYPGSDLYGVHTIVSEIIARWENSAEPLR